MPQRKVTPFYQPDVVDDQLESDLFPARSSLNSPVVPRAPHPPRAGQNHEEINNVHTPIGPTLKAQEQAPSANKSLAQQQNLNRHQRRRLEALMRQNKGRLSGKAPNKGAGQSSRPEPVSGQADRLLAILQNLTRCAVEGINEDGTFMSFLAKFENGEGIVVLDPTDQENAEQIVRSAMSGTTMKGFVGIMMPTINKGQIQMAAHRNSDRSQDMDKVMQIATQAIARKATKSKENNDHDSASRSTDQPAPGADLGILDGSDATIDRAGEDPHST